MLPSSVKMVAEEENKGVFEILGLYPGYGHTLGNSIRRILLSSLPGAAITFVKINNVNHEFSSVPGIKEDVIKILLNLKQLRFKLHGDDSQVAVLEARGAKEVTGKDIKCPSQLEVLNKNSHIFSLTDKNAKVSMELTVERGLGFMTAEEINKGKVAIGVLPLDAIFTPIRIANFEVENMRVGDRTDFNLLRITIETDGSITPREAFKESLSIMRQQIEKIEHFDEEENVEKESFSESEVEEKSQKIPNINDLKISQRTKNALSSVGISNSEELSLKSEEEISSIEGVGNKAVGEIKKALKKLGLTLRE